MRKQLTIHIGVQRMFLHIIHSKLSRKLMKLQQLIVPFSNPFIVVIRPIYTLAEILFFKFL